MRLGIFDHDFEMVLIEQFQQLGCRERRLRRASPPQDHDFANATARQRLQRMIGDVGLPELRRARSEEHTSELQSLMRISYAVFCLKKKIKYSRDNKNITQE